VRRTLRGKALTFGKFFRPTVSRDCPVLARYAGGEVSVGLGAVDPWLAKVKAGRARVELRFDHDPARKLIDTDDPSFDVWTAGDQLRFSVRPITRAGRAAIEAVRRSPERREVSVGINPVRWEDLSGCLRSTVAELAEISIHETGKASCPGTFVYFEAA
jgi:hypothetical protein